MAVITWRQFGLILAVSTVGAFGVCTQPKLTVVAVVLAFVVVGLFSLPKARRAEWCLVGQIGLMVAVPVLAMSGRTQLRDGAVAMCVLLAGIAGLRGARSRWTRSLQIGAIWLIDLVGITILNHDPGSKNRLIIAVAVAGSVAYTASKVRTSSGRRVVLSAVCAMALLEAGIAVWETVTRAVPLWSGIRLDQFGNPQPLNSTIWSGQRRAQGTLGHPIPLATLLLVGLVIVAWGAGPRTRRGCVAAGGLLIVGLFLTGTRSALGIGVVIVAYRVWGSEYRRIMGALLAVAVAVIIGPTVFTTLLHSASVSHRSGSISAIPNLLNQRLRNAIFGNGYYSSLRLYNTGILTNDGFHAVDNQAVTTLAEQGIVGVLLLGGIIYSAWRWSTGVIRWTLIVLVTMFAVFDVLDWPPMLALLAMTIGFCRPASDPAFPAPEPPVEAVPKGSRPTTVRLV